MSTHEIDRTVTLELSPSPQMEMAATMRELQLLQLLTQIYSCKHAPYSFTFGAEKMGGGFNNKINFAAIKLFLL